ncbi:cation diffusion facilitator family transporter [Xanthobacter autotrophicus]|jgi:cation diffusion facilitator family transporter|uniref:Cation transporter n=1 Tax=Xanthobacter autotrophicus TaxID=280 RepID=A0A6C1KC06_XANAU|nr:cation diffusion facilitator family transporter [Xanthobacter autotrophicus]TLX41710.1 cation transporter [Xanthobacter autotrophicus]
MSRKTLWVAAASVLVGIIVLGLKTLAWWVTGSVALLSDALESIINVAASGAALIALQVSSRPADDNHQFGHHKAEYISAVIEGVLVVIAALTIMREAYNGFQNPTLPDQPVKGMLLNGAATVVNVVWYVILMRVGRAYRSPALIADAKHLMSDVVTSAAVLAGFVLVPVTGWPQLDPLLAGLVALNVLWTGWGMMKESVGGLMDAAPPPDVVARIKELVSTHAAGAIEAHDLRTRHAGRITFVEFHLVVPGNMTVAAAHEICDRIEHAFEQDMDDAVITIHVEPEDEAKHRGVVVL